MNSKCFIQWKIGSKTYSKNVSLGIKNLRNWLAIPLTEISTSASAESGTVWKKGRKNVRVRMGRRLWGAVFCIWCGYWTHELTETVDTTTCRRPSQNQASQHFSRWREGSEIPPLAEELRGAELEQSLFSLRGMSVTHDPVSTWPHTQVHMGSTS